MTQRTPNYPGAEAPQGRTTTTSIGGRPGAPAQQQQNAGLDVMTKNQGDNVRKVHARELAANVVVGIFRLVKLSTLHSLDNQAMIRQVEDTVRLVAEYGQRTDHNVSILFAHGSVFVGGQLLRANRGVYEGALELGEILNKVGAAEIGIRREVQPNDFYAFASVLADALRKPKPPKIDRPSPNIRLRGLAASALLRENLNSERIDPNIQVARTYASAVVIMRRFFEDLRRGKYDLPQRVKRVAQRLVDLSMGETPAFLGVTAARNQNHDEAGRAVNTAIMSLAMTRQIAPDMVQLSRIAMAALLYDCARARIAGVVGAGPAGIMPQFSEQQELEAAAGTAVVLTALGRINEPSVMRTVISYEAHWQRRGARLGPVYRGLRAASLQARIVHIARAFNDMLTPAPGQTPPTADEAIAKLEQEATDPADRTVLRLLIGALGIFTTGTIVQINTGETGIVVQTPSHPALYSQPRVRLVLDANHGWLQPPLELDLAHQRRRPGETPRHIKEVVATADDPAGAQLRAYAAGPVQQMSGVRMQTGIAPGISAPPPSPGYGATPGYQQPSQPAHPQHQNSDPPSYQNNPPSYQTNPPSSQVSQQAGPPSYQVTPPSFQQQAPQYAQQQPHPQQQPYQQQPQQAYPPQQPQQAYPQQQPQQAYPPQAPQQPQYAQALSTPQPKGRASTLASPVFEPQAAPAVDPQRGRSAAFYDDRYEVAQPAPQQAQEPQRGRANAYYDDRFEVPAYDARPAAPPSSRPEPEQEDVIDDWGTSDDGAATRAVSWDDQARLLQQEQQAEVPMEVDEPPPPPPVAATKPEPIPARATNDDKPKGAPTAEGVLQKTPFVHLLIYMLDQRLSGTTVFTLSSGITHSVYFHDGTPAKVRTGGMIEPLDRVLVDQGLLDESTLRGTLMEVSKKGVLHGRLLVMKGLLSRENVIEALRSQVLRKVTHLFELPGETRYAYYKDQNLLANYGGPELTPTEPLATIMAGIRLMAGDALVDATLTKILGRPLALHIDAEMKRFAMTREEASVVDLMRTRRMTVKELILANVAPEGVVRLTVYALVVTRHLDLGVAGKLPVGLGRPLVGNQVIVVPQATPAPAPPAPTPPPAAASQPPATPARPRQRVATLGGDAPVSPHPSSQQATPQPQYAAPQAPQVTNDRASTRPRMRSATLGGEGTVAPPANAPFAAPQPQYATPAPPSPHALPYSPPQPQYGAPQPPQQPQYGAPQQPQYGAPQQPQQPQYGAPQQPQQPSYGAPQQPQQPSYGAPQQPQYSAPQAPYAPPQQQYAAPQGPAYGQPYDGGQGSIADMPPASRPTTKMPRVTPPMTPPQPPSSAPPTPRTAPPPRAAPPPAAPMAPAPQAERPEITARRAEIEARAKTIDADDYFVMLGVAREASVEQIKMAYFGLAKSWHPDRLPSELLDVKPQVARVFARYSEAYQTLIDPVRSKDYLAAVKQGGGSPDDQEKVARVVDAALEFQKAEILLKKNDLAGAEQLAVRAVAADPDQPEYITLLVWIRAMRRGDPPELREGQTSNHYDDLIKALDGVITKEKEFERALYYRGVLLKRAGRIDKAMRDFRMAAHLNPKNLDAIREVRLFEMRKRGGGGGGGGGSGPQKGQPPQQDGLFNKFFKR